MRVFILVQFVLCVSFVSCQKESLDNDTSTDDQQDRKSNDKHKNNQDSKSQNNNADDLTLERKNPEFFITPDDRLIINPRIQPGFYAHAPNNQIPGLGFPDNGNQRQSFILSDDTGRYNVQLQNFQQEKPTHFNAALGAISAHILGQRTNQEYIPYPPNGDPYNYPAYRGYPHATEPPVVRAYETSSNSNYGTQPSTNFNQYNPRRIFSNNGYHQGFPNQFDNFGLGFYNNPYVFNEGGFYSNLRRQDGPIFDDRYYDDRRGDFRRPIK